MSSQSSEQKGITTAKFARYALILVFIVIVLIAINAHLQNPVLVFGGGAAIIVAVLAHLGVLAGLMKMLASRRESK